MKTFRNIDELILFEAIRSDDIVRQLSGFVNNNANGMLSETDRGIYYALHRTLIRDIGRGEISGNYLQNYFCRIIGGEENVFARMAERGVYAELKRHMSIADIEKIIDLEAKSVILMAADEIEMIQALYNFDFPDLPGSNRASSITTFAAASDERITHREEIHKAMLRNKSLEAAVLLAHYYHSFGSGVFEASPALNAEAGGLAPVCQTDPITMDDLVGYASQKQRLIDNAEILMSGLQANNVLLYGDSGTGKSSSVKALLNMYSHRGLKMISVSKDKLGLLPGVLEQLNERGMKFIIFIDDLSFEENENEYKVFKSIMEGRISARPKNVIFIVTSNRRNIVKEVWTDREGSNDIRRRDNIQEKRSLSDRFGITLIYSEPDKREYLTIVQSMAKKSGLDMPETELTAKALEWEIRHGGRSGRTARQFVDYMAGINEIRTF